MKKATKSINSTSAFLATVLIAGSCVSQSLTASENLVKMNESFDADVDTLRQKGWTVPGFASVVGEIPGTTGKALRVQVDNQEKEK